MNDNMDTANKLRPGINGLKKEKTNTMKKKGQSE